MICAVVTAAVVTVAHSYDYEFPFKKVFRKIKISQRRKKVATNFGRFLESSEHFFFFTTIFVVSVLLLQSFMSKNSIEGVKV